MQYPKSITDTSELLSRLPGIGERTAQRLVLAMLKWPEESVHNLATAVQSLNEVNYCKECGFFSELDLCHICSDASRKQNKDLCVVETVSDLVAIEKSGDFHGVYHVLSGVLNPLAGIGPEQLRLDLLKNRVLTLEVESVILAINPSVEGDATCAYIKNLLRQTNARVDRIGLGVPMGGNLEFLDGLTISKALENRTAL